MLPKTSQHPSRRDSQTTISTENLGDSSDHDSVKRIIEAYTPSRGHQDEKLAKCLNAFLDILPQEGATRIANDILRCGNDPDKLFEVFESLRTGLLIPSK